jgi:hypothetical protein
MWYNEDQALGSHLKNIVKNSLNLVDTAVPVPTTLSGTAGKASGLYIANHYR